MKKILSVLSISLLLAACNPASEQTTSSNTVNQQEQSVAADHHTAQNSLDLGGSVRGAFTLC
ncbi:hypothetical protein OURE66S_02645 [Oligella ureolytica]